MDEQSIFALALEKKPTGERDAFLDKVCAGNTQLRAALAALLQAHEKPDSFLDAPGGQILRTIDEPAISEKPGTLIGPYKLLEQIGEGGFGVVFMAEQLKPVRRMVALKVIKPGMDSRQVVARFEAERQALAMMDHPNIAKVLGAGATDAGRPYFVMELVRGIPITDYCDQAGFSVRVRLQLFVQVCRAVQHAHTKGVIHRDLKPGNVLVTSHDGVPVPYVIDFGVAKALGQQLSERSVHTGFAQLLGTPLYMSPEQAELNELGVDTRSDIYSLGVLLYELLTAATPFDKERLRTVDFDEMRRILREEEPPRPSTRLSTLGAALSTVSERRGVDPRKLTQTLTGELDWIVLKALDKDRARRYETASAFAADVERYLNDEAVEACPPSAVYRLRKYAQRHRPVLAMAAIIAAALVAATAVSTWQAVLARHAQHHAETAESRAATDAAIARAVNDFLQEDLLGQAASAPDSDTESRGETNLTVREALKRAAARIGHRFQDQPLVQAAIQTSIGTAFNNLSEEWLAVPHLEWAVTLRKEHLGPDHADTFVSMHSLAAAYIRVGRDLDAIVLFQQIFEHQRAMLGLDDPTTLQSMGSLACAYRGAGQWDTSERLLEYLVEKRRTICGPTHSDTLGAMKQLALNYEMSDRLAEAMAMYENVVKGFKSTASSDQQFSCRLWYAWACQRAGKLDQAESLLREALIYRRPNGFQARMQTANAFGWLARTLLLQEKYADAEPLIREAVAIFEKESPDQPRRFYWVSLLGGVLLGLEEYSEAEPLLLQGYEGMKQRAGHEWTRLPETVERIVRFYEVTNQPDMARVAGEGAISRSSEMTCI